jgi:NADH-quinone oxidoreductase subunit F
VIKQFEGHPICALGDAAAWHVEASIWRFWSEIELRINQHGGAQTLETAE